MSSWAYADRQDLEAWNSKRVLSSHPSPIPLAPLDLHWNFANLRSHCVCCLCIKMEPLACFFGPTLHLQIPLGCPKTPLMLLQRNFFKKTISFSLNFCLLLLFFFFLIKILLCFYICVLCEKKGDRGERSLFSSRGENSLVSSRCKAPKQLLSALKLKRLGPPPSTPRALHIILSCNSHCNCRYPDC